MTHCEALDEVASAVENRDIKRVEKMAARADLGAIRDTLRELRELMSDETVTIQIIRRKNTRQIFVIRQATGAPVLSMSWLKGGDA